MSSRFWSSIGLWGCVNCSPMLISTRLTCWAEQIQILIIFTTKYYFGYMENVHPDHTEEKQFKCKFCDKTFSENKYLKVHMRIHTGEKPYLCRQCPKAFTTNNGLKCHIKTHTGEKPYPCNKCPSDDKKNWHSPFINSWSTWLGATCVRRTALIAIYELKSFAACISVGITVA